MDTMLINISGDLHKLAESVEKIHIDFTAYQASVFNQPWFNFILGGVVTFFVSFFLSYINSKKERKNYLYFLERVIVDQMNYTIDMKRTIINFLEGNLKDLIQNIESSSDEAYSMHSVFFPKFSVRPIPEQVNMTSSGSGYIDNKVAKIYALSKDMPHIIEDCRNQLEVTLQKNDRMVFGKLNPPKIQKKQFKNNIERYIQMIHDDAVEKNIPIYLKKLSETLVAVREKARRSSFSWKLKFDPDYKLFILRRKHAEEKGKIAEKMDTYFEPQVKSELKDIEDKENN